MYKDLQRTCTAIVLLIKSLVWWPSRCHHIRGLLLSSLVLLDTFTPLKLGNAAFCTCA